MRTLFVLFAVMLSIQWSPAQNSFTRPKSVVDYDKFMDVSKEVRSYRLDRLIDIETFNAYAAEPNTIILDTRPLANYMRKHIKGAIHLNFSDFAEEKLAKIIPDKNTRILIYCNNNFKGDMRDFVGKLPPLALNIPTFINLYGYGYRNVYELRDLIHVSDPIVSFAGIEHKPPYQNPIFKK